MAVYKKGQADNGVYHFPKKFVTLYASAACTAGQWVAITTDTTNGLGASVANAPEGPSGTHGNSLTCGIATQTVAAGEDVVVQIAGKYEDAYVDGACDYRLPLIGPLSTGTAGMVSMQSAATFGPVIGIGLEADATNLADVMIINQGFFD